VSQQCAQAARKDNRPVGCIDIDIASWVREGIDPLLCAAAASPGALGALLGTTEHKRHKAIGDCPKEGTTTERSEVQSFLGADCLLRLTPSHIPQPGMRHTACMGLGSHSIHVPHAGSGSCCHLVFHLTSYKPASHCPRKGPEPA